MFRTGVQKIPMYGVSFIKHHVVGFATVIEDIILSSFGSRHHEFPLKIRMNIKNLKKKITPL